MGAIVGIFKFMVGVVLGAATGATVATLIITRNGQETVEKLRGVFDEVVESGKQAASEEEARMEGRRNELIGEAAEQRQLKAAENKAVKKAKEELKKEFEKKNKK
jgi:gas vesicle protein